MKRIAIVRGPGLSKWEMQIYEPLSKWFDLLGLGSKKPVNDIGDITFPTKELYCPIQYIANIPKITPFMFKLFGDTQWLANFNKSIAGVNIVHSAELRNAYSLQAVIAKKNGLIKAVTMTVYENIPFLNDEFEARRKLKEKVIFGTDHFFAANKAARQALLIEGVEKDNISIIPQSVDTKIFRPNLSQDYLELNRLRKKFGFNENDFVVLSVGRMVWEKGWYDIFRAAIKIRNERKIKFLLVGDGPEYKLLSSFIRREGLDKNMRLTGKIPYHQMPNIFRLADIFVLASLPTKVWNEQFGGVLAEAMATGLPIVGTLSGGIRDTVGISGGIFIQPQSFFQLEEAIISFFKDTRLGRKAGKRNRKFAIKNYDVHVVAKKIKMIWDRF